MFWFIVWCIGSFIVVLVYAKDTINLIFNLKKCCKQTDATLVNVRYSIDTPTSRSYCVCLNVFYRCRYEIDNIMYSEESIMPHKFVVSGCISDVNNYITKSVGEKKIWVYDPNNKKVGYILEDKNMIISYIQKEILSVILGFVFCIVVGYFFLKHVQRI